MSYDKVRVQLPEFNGWKYILIACRRISSFNKTKSEWIKQAGDKDIIIN